MAFVVGLWFESVTVAVGLWFATPVVAVAGVPFCEAYRAAAASADSAGQGRTPEGSLAARVSPGSAADLRLDELRTRWEAL